MISDEGVGRVFLRAQRPVSFCRAPLLKFAGGLPLGEWSFEEENGVAKTNGAAGVLEADRAVADGNPAQPSVDAKAEGTAQQVSPEVLAQIGALRSKIQLSVGQIVLSIMNLPRYRHLTLADLPTFIMNPLLRDRLAIAHKGVAGEDGQPKIYEESIAGIAIWASVSDEVDAKITERVKAGVFPVRLGADDWVSGENVWLLDMVAADRKAATSVLANFRQVTGERAIKIHPIVARLIDPAVLEKLRGAASASVPQVESKP